MPKILVEHSCKATNEKLNFEAIASVPHIAPNGIMSNNASVNSKRKHSPGNPPGEFFKIVKSPASGQNLSAKARPPSTKAPTPGEYFRRSSQPFLLISVEILEFCKNQALKRVERLSNYSLVISFSFSLSAILYR